MGIGLSICKTIVSAHGGDIKARNHNEGSEFYFLSAKGKGGMIMQQKITVLIIEDEKEHMRFHGEKR